MPISCDMSDVMECGAIHMSIARHPMTKPRTNPRTISCDMSDVMECGAIHMSIARHPMTKPRTNPRTISCDMSDVMECCAIHAQPCSTLELGLLVYHGVSDGSLFPMRPIILDGSLFPKRPIIIGLFFQRDL